MDIKINSQGELILRSNHSTTLSSSSLEQPSLTFSLDSYLSISSGSTIVGVHCLASAVCCTQADLTRSCSRRSHQGPILCSPTMTNPNSRPTSTSNPTSQRGNNASPTGNGQVNHGNGAREHSTLARSVLPEMTDRDRAELGLQGFDSATDPSDQTGQSTSPTAARNGTPNGTSGNPQEPLYLVNLMSRGEDVNSQGRDSTPSASMVSADTSNSRTPNNTPQDNAEGDRRDHRAERSTIASYDQLTPANLNNHLRDCSADESRLSEEAIHSQNDEPSACMSEFWTYSRNGFDTFHTNSSEPPVVAVTENPALLGAPQTNHFNPQADDSSNPGVFNVTPFGNNTPATHTVTNGSVPNHNHQAGSNISDSTLREEERPTRLSDFLLQADPATQEQWQDEWTAALSGHASDPVRRPETPLPTGNVENGNARAQDSLGDVASVDVSGLQLGTPTNGMLAVLETFSQYPEDEANSASGEDTTAGSQANPTNPTRRRFLIPLADNNPNSTRVANGRVDNHDRRTLHVGSLRRMTSEENRAFWREFSDSENDRGST
ncbi:hypothetical protein BU23DRAFT_600616 [Bimuria novae-zelandiae CBS 107.79]|uniref:Uncharacterized protein n=1 Tax=Bimuria novae-zelandiae CBS 107.79 TaxID=1447943 RepID=A0A6A5V485_9PLEO|nr:hypothetical protein BU23DRAFT_600616 [Bimuria novae-zelandiae CBS 107.79]